MSTSRREFLRISALIASGLALPFSACNSSDPAEKQAATDSTATTATKSPPTEASSLGPFGIQLWTVKEAMQENPKETLRQLASFGYKQIESFEGEKGMFWGMTNTEFRDYMEELGMKLVASHCNVKEKLAEKARQAKEIGMDYLIDPWEGPQENLAAYKALTKKFTEYGKLCQDNGLRFAYHNHDYSFKEVEGLVPQKMFLDETDPELVDFEMDIYWVVTAGADPRAYLRDYPGRFKLCHIKDRNKQAPASEAQASTILGQGSIPYTDILTVARKQGMRYFIAEQERFEGTTPIESSRQNAQFLKQLKV